MVVMKTKQCFKCKQEKTLDCFYKHPDMPDGTVNKCKECNKADVQNNYAKKRDYYKEYDKRRYREDEKRLIQHKYKDIVNRSNNRGSHKYSVNGMKYLSKKSFLTWWKKNQPKYQELYEEWKKSGYTRKLAPSIDRIDSKKGYFPANMQWLTLSENCKKYNK
jgi:hypothetical protein